MNKIYKIVNNANGKCVASELVKGHGKKISVGVAITSSFFITQGAYAQGFYPNLGEYAHTLSPNDNFQHLNPLNNTTGAYQITNVYVPIDFTPS